MYQVDMIFILSCNNTSFNNLNKKKTHYLEDIVWRLLDTIVLCCLPYTVCFWV